MKRIKPFIAFASDRSGAAAVEFAIWLVVLAYPLVNVVDLGLYAYKRTQVENAAEMGLQAVYTSCGQLSAVPVLQYCNSGNAGNLVTAGVQSTSLGANVTVSAKYECNGGSITYPTGATNTPSCPTSSGDYVGVTVAYTYTPLFRLATVASVLGTSMTRTFWMRMV